MAEDDGDKTEAPTPRRRQEARDQGQIARSQDLSGAAMLVGTMVLLGMFGQNIIETLREITFTLFGAEAINDLDGSHLGELVLNLIGRLAIALAPMFIGIAILAVFVNVIQTGLVFSTKRIEPNLGALNPIKGFKKLFGGGKGAVGFLMNLAKLVLVAFVAYSAVHNKLGTIVAVQTFDYLPIFALASQIVYSMAIRIGVVLLILAIIDYVYQRFKHEKDLKMTKQQVKDEMKKMEGDPQIKQRRRQIQMQRAMGRINKAVPEADVIVTNPTHFAIALKYEEGMRAPKVVAKGADFLAQKIREIAAANGIPIIERPPLARAMYKLCDVGQEIPEDFYNAVAEILAYVWELNGKARQRATAGV